MSQRSSTYTISCPVSLNNHLDFSSMPPILVVPLFMYVNMRDVPESKKKHHLWTSVIDIIFRTVSNICVIPMNINIQPAERIITLALH